MLDYLTVYKCQFKLRKLLSSLYTKLLRSVPIKLRLCKRVSTFLAKKDLIPTSWLCKPSVEVPVNLTGKGPMLAIHINGVQASAILDTGSTFPLIPFPL